MGDYGHLSEPLIHPHGAPNSDFIRHQPSQHVRANGYARGIDPMGEGVAGDGFLK